MKLSMNILWGVAVLLLLAVAGYLGYQYKAAHDSLVTTAAELAQSTFALETLRSELEGARDEGLRLSEALHTEQRRNDSFQERIDEISGTVGKLDKLSQLDPELLQKYSKVYFLSEHFVPSALLQLPEEWTFNGQEEYFHKEAWPFLKRLLEEAQEDGIELRIVSGYRSFGTQELLKSSYSVQYGSGANIFSADQGYSEHQLGTAFDVTSLDVGDAWGSLFGESSAYLWLTENAHKYGFALSYPERNGYYIYEPWHWRFVGEELAEYLHEEGVYFYDLDQREIDSYLINIFE